MTKKTNKWAKFSRSIYFIVIKKIFFGEYEVLEKNLTKELQESFYDLVERWSSNIAERTAKQFESGADVKEIKKWMSDVYYPHVIDEYADKVDNKNIIAYLTFLNDKSVAFTSAYPINQNCLAVNASFCDIGYEGLIQYQFFSLAARAKLLGYKYLNLGSNDIESQYLYKSTLGEIAKVYPYILKFAAQKNWRRGRRGIPPPTLLPRRPSKNKGQPRRLLVQSRTPKKSFVFLLEERSDARKIKIANKTFLWWGER